MVNRWPYNTQQWQRLRREKLAAEPLCEPCKRRGRVTAANTVDHRTAVKAGGDPFPPIDGLESMCPPCHAIKTAAEDRPDRRAGRGFLRGCDADGNPLDPDHPFIAGETALGGTSKIGETKSVRAVGKVTCSLTSGGGHGS